MKSIFVINHFKFIDQIVLNKRKEMVNIINEQLKNIEITDALDIGSTNDEDFESSNYLIKNINRVKYYKSISDQIITDKFFSSSLIKSITDDFSNQELEKFKSDLVISNATIEHVGSLKNQIKMISNIVKLSKKLFILTTPTCLNIDFLVGILFETSLFYPRHLLVLQIIYPSSSLKFFSPRLNF